MRQDGKIRSAYRQSYRDKRITLVATNSDRMRKPGTHTSDRKHLSGIGKMKTYCDIVASYENTNKLKITIRSKGNQTPETIKELIKRNINSTEERRIQ